MKEVQSIQPSRYLKLKPGKIFNITALSVLFLGLTSSILTFFKYYLGNDGSIVHYLLRLFYMDKEKNVPTYVSSILLLATFIFLIYIFYANYLKKNKYRYHWLLLAVIFLGISMDEFMELHESLIDPVREFLNPSDWFHFAWVIPGIIAVCIGGLFFMKFILSLRPGIRNMFIGSALLYVSGAIGFEIVSGYVITNEGSENFLFAMASNIEETLEMLGITYFIYALLLYIKTDLNQKLQICILSSGTGASGPGNLVKPVNGKPTAHILKNPKIKKPVS